MRTLFSLTLIALLAAACGTMETQFEADDPEQYGVLEEGKADSVSSTSTYYTIRRDFRRCMAPICGGFWVKRVNRSSTRCADRQYRAECYVANLDGTPVNLTQAKLEEMALFRGSIRVWRFNGVNYGKLWVTEGWVAGGQTPASGIFYRLKDNGIRCITTPCFSLHEAKLNSTVSTNVSGVDLSGARADAAALEEAYRAMSGANLLVAVDRHDRPSGPAGAGSVANATQFYLQAAPRTSVATQNQ